jgi:hypothetical protein
MASSRDTARPGSLKLAYISSSGVHGQRHITYAKMATPLLERPTGTPDRRRRLLLFALLIISMVGWLYVIGKMVLALFHWASF